MYFVYILYSETIDQTYIGFTTDLKKRIQVHKTSPTRTTKRANDYQLIWYCCFNQKKQAEEFEIYLKSGSGRAFLKRHILKDMNPKSRRSY